MSYFNHSFQKLFLGTENTSTADADHGFLTVANLATSTLKGTYGTGIFTLVDPANYESVNNGSATLTAGKPLILASTSLYTNDKISPFLGGYQETNKSKLINPKYISRFYRVDPCLPNNNIVHLGVTPYTESASPSPTGCCHDFFCDQTYYLRMDVKGSPVLRFLTRNAYWTADYYTGCCDDPTTPVAVDPTLVYIGWATGFLGQGTLGAENFIPNKIVGPFISIVVYDYTGTAWYQPGTNGGVSEWDAYEASATHTAFDPSSDICSNNVGAGMTVTGAYVDTQFGDCTFYPSDFFQKEPVHIYMSEVDEDGDVCTFTGICFVEQCPPRQGMGFGDTVLKDLILSESYRQNDFYTGMDLRIREITQGYDISSAVDRTAQYYRYIILHSVPRFNNPTGVFDNDQYMLEIITTGVSAAFETAMDTWLTACGCNAELETFSCGAACP